MPQSISSTHTVLTDQQENGLILLRCSTIRALLIIDLCLVLPLVVHSGPLVGSVVWLFLYLVRLAQEKPLYRIGSSRFMAILQNYSFRLWLLRTLLLAVWEFI